MEVTCDALAGFRRVTVVQEVPVILRPPTRVYWATPSVVFVLLLICFLAAPAVAWRRGEFFPAWLVMLSFLIPALVALGQLWHSASERITFLLDGIELRTWLRPARNMKYREIDGYYSGFTLRVSRRPQSKVLSRGGHAIKIHGKIVRLYALDPRALEAEFRRHGVPVLDAKTFYKQGPR